MKASAREKIFKSWSGIDEVALIKEVATKGENIQLCIEYWARKRKMTVPEYKLYFHDVVQTYVQRLLTERLIYKAEMVLRNVELDISCFYFQFMCECTDAELRELILDYLKKREGADFEHHIQELQEQWDLLQQLLNCPNLLPKCKSKLGRLTLQNFMACELAFKRHLLVELYFEQRNSQLLKHLNKYVVWEFLLETQQAPQIIRWLTLNGAEPLEVDTQDELELMYSQWPLEPEMYEQALRQLKQPSEALRNSFARSGHFFADERDQVALVLRRIATTESFMSNSELLEKLPLGRFLLSRGQFYLMLRDFVSVRELEELADKRPGESELLRLIASLKNCSLENRLEFEMVSHATKTYLESQEVDFQVEQPLVTLYDFLCNQPTVSALNCFLLSSALKRIPYLRSLALRLESNTVASNGDNVPTAYDLFRKFKLVDFREISKDTPEVASFSNERLCQKYARKYQLNYLHYLKQHRSAYAVYYFLTEQLQTYAQISKSQLFSASETVTELALQHANNLDLIAHCVAFNEMLGFDTQNLRSFLKLTRLINDDSVAGYDGLIVQVERHLLASIVEQPNAEFPLADYQALLRMVACHQQRRWPRLVLQRYATEDNWWRLLVLLHYFETPLEQLRMLIAHFETRAVGEHLLRALSYEAPPIERSTRRHSSLLQRQQKYARKGEHVGTTSNETMASSQSSCSEHNAHFRSSHAQQLDFLLDMHESLELDLDLFAIILLSSNATLSEETAPMSAKHFFECMHDSHAHCTSMNLLRNAIKYRLPVLAVLAATVNSNYLGWNWLVWLAVAIEQCPLALHANARDLHELVWSLIEHAVRQNATNLLYMSFSIFFEDNPLVHLFKFLYITKQNHDFGFGDEAVHSLRLYLLAWSNDEVRLPLVLHVRRDQLMLRTMKLLLLHLQLNFDSAVEQQRFLQTICKSDMGDICSLIDFCQLSAVFAIVQATPGGVHTYPIHYEDLLQPNDKSSNSNSNTQAEYNRLLAQLYEAKEYDAAIRLATLLHQPICDIVYSKWVASMNKNNMHEVTLQQYEDEIAAHSLPPELLVNFFLYAASTMKELPERQHKYLLLKRALNVIKKNHLFPNESFNRDQIEYEMIVSYLQIENPLQLIDLDIYHSEYYEQIMLKERCVLYKSFLELKELAGIEDLTTSLKMELSPEMHRRLEALLNRLLDEGDIVEALRLQELFECRPIDLRFVVFCMALAEGVTTIYGMSSEERQLLSDVEKSSFAKFNRRTLGNIRTSTSSSYQSHSPLHGNSEFSDSCSTLEFEEIPSKERRETLEIIQGIASKLKHGIDLGKRVVMAYRAAMYLDKEYLDVLRTKDTSVLLKSVAEEGCLHRLMVVSDIITSTQMSSKEIAELLAYEITVAVVRPRFYIFSPEHQQTKANSQKNADLWGYNIDRDLHLFLELTPSTTKLGNCLLEYCDALKAYRKFQDNKPFQQTDAFEHLADIIARYGVPNSPSPTSTHTSAASPQQVLSHKKQNQINVELLIKAHQCFVRECSMEGIANVLNRAKALNAILAAAKSWSLIVRMLIGIARYREMFYCFDTLIENDQFESLLGQFDEEKTIVLRQAILSYIREYQPTNGREYLKLAALHFLMYKELAEMWEQDAQEIIDHILSTYSVHASQLSEQISMANITQAVATKISIPKFRCSTELLSSLQKTMENYTHATENYLLDSKLLLGQRAVSMAELVAMQIDLATKALEKQQPPQLCVCVVNVQGRDAFRELVNSELSVPQALILSRAYGFYDVNWTEALLSQFVILKKQSYLNEFIAHIPITDSIIENVVKGFQLYAAHNNPSLQMEKNLAQLVGLVKSVTLKYKLASLLSLKSTVMSLINEQTVHYLKDTNYGRSNVNQNIPDL